LDESLTTLLASCAATIHESDSTSATGITHFLNMLASNS
jgi:hypothetical protein